MEIYFLLLLIVLMAGALASGYPVAFALPGSAILTILAASLAGLVFEGSASAFFAQGDPWQWLSAGVTNFRGVYWEVERDTLIAIPLFIFMGIMLQRSKIAEDLLVTMAQLFGPVPGGLGISVVFVGALLAATTGIVGATVVAMGLISLPAMMRNNYSHPLATGTISASGTLGQIIPPSIVLIILADQLSSAVDQAGTARKSLYKIATGQISLPSSFDIVSTSAGDMFLGALVPGLILVALYMAYILGFALLRPKVAPAIPLEGGINRRFIGRVLLILVPPLTLIFLVLGSIITGVATVNQAGAIGAVGATVMAGARLKGDEPRAFWPAIMALVSIAATMITVHYLPVNVKDISGPGALLGLVLASIFVTIFLVAVGWSGWRVLRIDKTMHSVMIDTAKTTSLVFIILLGAAMLTAAFRAFGGEDLVRNFLTGLPGGFWGQFITVMAVIFVLGFFLDFIEISVVVVPIVAPILLADPAANVTAVWLGVMIGLNIQTSFLTPPFGFALFYLRGVAPAAVSTISMYKGVVPFIILQLVALGIVALNPPLVNYLPQRISLLSVTAPPPINPRIQGCVEKYIRDRFDEKGAAIKAQIEAMRGLDVKLLPARLRRQVTASFDNAEGAFARLKEIDAADAKLDEVRSTYAPLHRQVRGIEVLIADRKKALDKVRQGLGRLGDTGSDQAGRARIERRVAALEREIGELKASIPGQWKAAHEDWRKRLAAANAARNKYRRTLDDAWTPIDETIATIKGVEKLKAMRDEVAELAAKVTELPVENAAKRVSSLSVRLAKIKGTNAIRKALKFARRAIKSKKPKPEKAIKEMAKAVKLLEKEIAWRDKARTALLPKFAAYADLLRDNIGLRQQRRMTREQALFVAWCSSGHEDISLSF